MSWPIIVCDPGSCWMGKKEFAQRLIVAAKEAGCDAVKFQLFEGEEFRKAGNIEMPLSLFYELQRVGRTEGIPVTASVFNQRSLEALLADDCHHIKFAYSQRHELKRIEQALEAKRKVVVTTHIMDKDIWPKHPNLIKLFVASDSHGPLYPCNFELNFDGLFPDRFRGFSDHTLGSNQAVKAVNAGATWIEKHIRLDNAECEEVPDGRFALRPDELKEFVKRVRG